MNKLKKCTAMILVLIMALSCFVYGNAIKAQAASTQFSISLSSSSVSKGGSVTVTVSVSCSEALGAYSYCLSYDSSVLEYTSGDGYAEAVQFPVPDTVTEISNLLLTALHFLLSQAALPM